MKYAWLLLLAACDSGLDQRLAIIHEPRVLAVIAEPPEVKPSASATYAIVIATPDGPASDPPSWAYCTAPKPPTEDNVVPPACLTDAGVVALGSAPNVAAPVPSDACLRYGPDTPPGGFRPRDADESGGYYQPVRAIVLGETAFGLERITCKLPSAPADLAHDYDLRYVANANPELAIGVPATVAANSDVELVASWPPESAESYLYFDRDAQELVTRREAMRVSWFATGGSLDVDATAVGEDDPATQVTTTWHAPASGPAWLWFVLRDSRGGIATQMVQIAVQ